MVKRVTTRRLHQRRNTMWLVKPTSANDNGKPTSGPRLPIHPPRRHTGLECGLEGENELLKLVKRHAREVQELYRAGLQVSEPYTSPGTFLLSLYGSVRGASYQKESGINSIDYVIFNPGGTLSLNTNTCSSSWRSPPSPTRVTKCFGTWCLTNHCCTASRSLSETSR